MDENRSLVGFAVEQIARGEENYSRLQVEIGKNATPGMSTSGRALP
jgi:hypothetical protein